MTVVMVEIFTDGCTYHNEVARPINYDTPEAALLDFCDLLESNIKSFVFCGIYYYPSYFSDKENLPDFYTIEEWVEKYQQ